jgi:RND family efflux transporter MFP subunit
LSNENASKAGLRSAITALEIEEKSSNARIAQARSQVQQAEANLAASRAKLELAIAGPRTQEVSQTKAAVAQAQATLKLAQTELDRVRKLVEAGAFARRELDVAQSRYEVAKSQLDAALQTESIAKEGTRRQDIKAAEEVVAQAEAALKQARSGVSLAEAAALQVKVRQRDIESASAQVQQATAAVNAAQVTLSYATVTAPFDGVVTKRLVDPGALASPGTPLLQVQGGEFLLEISVPEKIAAVLKRGQGIMTSIESAAQNPIRSEVAEVVPQADTTTHSFLVKLRLDQNQNLKSGQFGRAQIQTGTSKKITVPESVTWEREGMHYAFVVNKDGLARLRIVTLGEIGGGRYEVLSGLVPGEKVVLQPAKVKDGMKVLEAKS